MARQYVHRGRIINETTKTRQFMYRGILVNEVATKGVVTKIIGVGIGLVRTDGKNTGGIVCG